MAQSLSDIVELETPNGRTVRVRAVTHPRARRLSLTIGAGGPRVSAPEGTHPATVRAFLREHAGWLQKKLRELELTGRKLAPPVPGRAETFTFRGVQLPVIWQHDRFPRIAVAPGRLDFALDLEHADARHDLHVADENAAAATGRKCGPLRQGFRRGLGCIGEGHGRSVVPDPGAGTSAVRPPSSAIIWPVNAGASTMKRSAAAISVSGVSRRPSETGAAITPMAV